MRYRRITGVTPSAREGITIHKIARRLLALVIWIFVSSGCDKAPTSVLLVTVDTLRADHLSAYGYPMPTAPAIDGLADRGVLFRFAFATSSSTAPSHTSIFTGRYPGFHTVGNRNTGRRLHRSETTLAEVLSAHGYATAAIVSNPILRKRLGLDQGFDNYDDEMEGRELNRKIPEQYADRAVAKAIAKLDALGSSRFFFWIHLMDPHGPYDPPEKWQCPLEDRHSDDERQLMVGHDHSGYQAIPLYQRYWEERRVDQYRWRYDCEIAFFDSHLERLLSYLEQHRHLRETLVILTADHGEAFGEDGFYFAHGHSVGEDQVRVPLILAGPGLPRGREVRTPASNASLFATILDLLELEIPHGRVEPSLLPLITGPPPVLHPVFVESLNQVGVISGNTFLRRDRYPPEETQYWKGGNPNSAGGFWKPLGRQVVWPLDSSAGEARETVTEIEKRLTEFERQAAAIQPLLTALEEDTSFSEEEQEALRSLGYLH